MDVTQRLCGHAGRLVRHRMGPSALDGLWSAAHGAKRFAAAAELDDSVSNRRAVGLHSQLCAWPALFAPLYQFAAATGTRGGRQHVKNVFIGISDHGTRRSFRADFAVYAVDVYLAGWGRPGCWHAVFWFRDEQQKQRMVHSILPVWDANETWLVLLAGGMLALFPAAYSKLFSVLYLPVFVMLLCLFIRALALEYRAQAGAVCGAGWINYCLLPPPARLFVRAGARALCLKARACWDSASMPCCVA